MADKKRSLEEDGEHRNGDDTKKAKKASGGILLFCGATDWSDVGRKSGNLPRSPNTIYTPMRLSALDDVRVLKVASGPASAHCLAIADDGRVFSWGRNEKGQLGLGHIKDRKCPSVIKELADRIVIDVATGRNHSLFLTEDGGLFACGDNKYGQAVGGAKQDTVKEPKQIDFDGATPKRIACGAEFSAVVDKNGSLWTWGHPENGQLGLNSEGKFLEKANKISFRFVYEPTKVTQFVERDPKAKQTTVLTGVTIRDVTCGVSHGVAVDERNRVFTWGFGGYGRLGHSETTNELVPRMVKFFDGPKRGANKVVAGGCFTLATGEVAGCTYMWGQYCTNKEANMYPKPIMDLSGWMDIRAIACSSKGWMVSADEDTVIGMAPSPAYGELGMGENQKSSAAPLEIKTLHGFHISDVACGLSHTLFVARCESEKDEKAIKDKFKVLDQSKLD